MHTIISRSEILTPTTRQLCVEEIRKQKTFIVYVCMHAYSIYIYSYSIVRVWALVNLRMPTCHHHWGSPSLTHSSSMSVCGTRFQSAKKMRTESVWPVARWKYIIRSCASTLTPHWLCRRRQSQLLRPSAVHIKSTEARMLCVIPVLNLNTMVALSLAAVRLFLVL